jgi:protein TonB
MPAVLPGFSLIALAATLAAAGAAADGVRIVDDPVWERQPSLGDVIDVYRTQRVPVWKGGHAAIRCRVTGRGELTACRVASEDPPGAGFGAAALKLAPIFRMRATGRDGRPVQGAQVTVPIEFAPIDSSTATRIP